MKKQLTAAMSFFVFAAAAFAQSNAGGMSLNGVTGLIATPTAYIGWEDYSDLGLDAGYHFVRGNEWAPTNNRKAYITHIPKLSLSIMKTVEVSFAFDTMSNWTIGSPKVNPYSILFNGKVQLFRSVSTSLSMGGNFQSFRDFPLGSGKSPPKYAYTAVQLYLVASSAGYFFGMPASTSVVVGKTFGNEYLGIGPTDLDFSVGFDITVFPVTFRNYVHWLNDFSNYSYSAGWTTSGSTTKNRGSYNTGIRVLPLKNKDYKLAIDAILMEILDDDDRSFILGVTFGVALW
jgi:hypothetical protein